MSAHDSTPDGLLHGVPVIDIAPFRQGSDSDRRFVAEQVAHACEEIGFLSIVGHGVRADVIDRTRECARRFFDLSEVEKSKFAAKEGVFRGYRGMQTTSLAASAGQATPADVKELFILGPPSGDEPYYQAPEAGSFFAPTPWPAEPPDFQEKITAYYRTMVDLSGLLRRIFATALGLREDWFEERWDRHTSNLSLVHYPPQQHDPLPGQLRAGAHADYGSFTILHKDEGEASLQVMRKDGEWIDVVPTDDAFVINIGDQFAQWTNDRWVSTKHRVVNPSGESARRRRLSMAFFSQPNYDAVVAPLDACLGPGEHPKYEPTTAGEILFSKFAKSTGLDTEREA